MPQRYRRKRMEGAWNIAATIHELLQLMWQNGQWWLIPLVVVLLLCAAIIVIGTASGVGPLIYTLF
jgi:hypothetical protein